MRLKLGKVTVAHVLAPQPVTTKLLKFMLFFFFLNDAATPEISTLSLPDALPISRRGGGRRRGPAGAGPRALGHVPAEAGVHGVRVVPGARPPRVRARHGAGDARLSLHGV